MHVDRLIEYRLKLKLIWNNIMNHDDGGTKELLNVEMNK